MKSLTAFLLYRRFLDGEDIRSFLAWARDVGANTVRVFGMSKWLDGGGSANEFIPQNYGERYYTELPAFVVFCAEQGFYVELTVFADANDIMASEDDQRRHLRRVLEALA